MSESEAKKRWMKENTRFYGLKLCKNTDADLISYLDMVSNVSMAIKNALREHIEAQTEGEK